MHDHQWAFTTNSKVIMPFRGAEYTELLLKDIKGEKYNRTWVFIKHQIIGWSVVGAVLGLMVLESLQ